MRWTTPVTTVEQGFMRDMHSFDNAVPLDAFVRVQETGVVVRPP